MFRSIHSIKKYNDKADGYKYEWNNGIIEKTTSMKQIEQFIIDALSEFFYLNIKPKVGGFFSSEIETWTSPTQFRKPDLCYTSQKQAKLFEKDKAIPEFVIEIISKNDEINRVNDKVIEYFNAGVKVVWLIFPKIEQVHVYNSITDVKICRQETLCSAERAVAGFVLPAAEIFRREV